MLSAICCGVAIKRGNAKDRGIIHLCSLYESTVSRQNKRVHNKGVDQGAELLYAIANNFWLLHEFGLEQQGVVSPFLGETGRSSGFIKENDLGVAVVSLQKAGEALRSLPQAEAMYGAHLLRASAVVII